MSSRIKRQARKLTAPKVAPAAMRGRSAHSANHRVKMGKAKITLAGGQTDTKSGS